MPPKNLFDDSSDDEVEQPKVTAQKKVEVAGKRGAPDDSIQINSAYATKYDQVKRKQELQRLTAKYGAEAGGDDSDDEESDEEDEGSEDDDAHYLTSDKEVAFAEVFHKIRTNPELILRNKDIRFFAKDGTVLTGTDSADKKKPFLLKDEYQRTMKQIVERGGEAVDDEAEERDESVIRKIKPSTSEEKKLRAAFLESANAATDSFDVKLVAKGPKVTVSDDAKKKAASLLHEAFAKAPISSKPSQKVIPFENDEENEKFLERFFVDELWRTDGTGEDEDEPYDWETAAKEDQDELFFDEAEQWEREYQEKQFRHEEGDAALHVQTFPRSQGEGTLRKKDTTRKEMRARREERKKDAALREVEELKRLKALKRKEIDEQRALIAKVAGIKDLEKVGITKEFLEKDFDPAEFDKKMAAIFDHTYDNDVDDEEMDFFDQELDDGVAAGENLEDVDPELAAAAATSDVDEDSFDDTMEATVAKAQAKKKKNLGPSSAVSLPQFLADDDLAMLYPDEALTALESIEPESLPSDDVLKQNLQSKVDEYYKLHFHKITGDIRTRFRYREVNPESFGITDMDVLTKDDRQLNMLAPLNCYAAYLGRNENTRDRYKALHRRNTLREIGSERKSRRYGDVAKTAILDAAISEEEGQKIAQKIHENTKRLREEKDLDKPPAKASRLESNQGTTVAQRNPPTQPTRHLNKPDNTSKAPPPQQQGSGSRQRTGQRENARGERQRRQ